jgi:hypothetical protein
MERIWLLNIHGIILSLVPFNQSHSVDLATFLKNNSWMENISCQFKLLVCNGVEPFTSLRDICKHCGIIDSLGTIFDYLSDHQLLGTYSSFYDHYEDRIKKVYQ